MVAVSTLRNSDLKLFQPHASQRIVRLDRKTPRRGGVHVGAFFLRLILIWALTFWNLRLGFRFSGK